MGKPSAALLEEMWQEFKRLFDDYSALREREQELRGRVEAVEAAFKGMRTFAKRRGIVLTRR